MTYPTFKIRKLSQTISKFLEFPRIRFQKEHWWNGLANIVKNAQRKSYVKKAI